MFENMGYWTLLRRVSMHLWDKWPKCFSEKKTGFSYQQSQLDSCTLHSSTVAWPSPAPDRFSACTPRCSSLRRTRTAGVRCSRISRGSRKCTPCSGTRPAATGKQTARQQYGIWKLSKKHCVRGRGMTRRVCCKCRLHDAWIRGREEKWGGLGLQPLRKVRGDLQQQLTEKTLFHDFRMKQQ